MTTPAPRTRRERRTDTLQRLTRDVDCWVASASEAGMPSLIPLSFDWNGEHILLATPTESPTGRNLAASGMVRLGFGPTRDVTLIDGTVEILPLDALAPEAGDRFAARTGFDPRTLEPSYAWFRVTPVRIQAWREANELSGRDLMRGGEWRE